MFILGTPFQPNLLLVGNAGVYHRADLLKGASPGSAPTLHSKIKSDRKGLLWTYTIGLLRTFVNYNCKTFYGIGPWGLVGQLRGRLGQVEAAEDGIVTFRMDDTVLERRRDSQYNDIQHNDSQHMTLSTIMSVYMTLRINDTQHK
jgi:hypothetical protein